MSDSSGVEFGGAHPYSNFAFASALSFRLMVRDAITGEEKQFCMIENSLEALQEIARFARVGVIAWAKPCDFES